MISMRTKEKEEEEEEEEGDSGGEASNLDRFVFILACSVSGARRPPWQQNTCRFCTRPRRDERVHDDVLAFLT